MEFKLLKKRVHNISGGNIGDFEAAPKRLEEVFGIPDYSEDDLKLSRMYYFEGEDGCIVRLYDWKSTNRFYSGFPSPKQFWALEYPQEFSVGSDDPKNAKPFFEWLQRQLEIFNVTLRYPEL